MDGIFCIDKPEGFTSFDVVAKVRGIMRTRKIGHAGTLDPMATGVLPLFLGSATKACDMLPCQDKRYIAAFRLGITTDTQDITGSVVSRLPVTASDTEVRDAILSYTGAQKQLPPMYSAVQVDGRRLYDLAREGMEVVRTPRDITIYGIKILNEDEAGHTYTIDVSCSKGTYIRTLCHDIGQSLDCGATLISLRRSFASGFHTRDCITLAQAQALADSGTAAEKLMPVDSVFSEYKKICLDDIQTKMFASGLKLSLLRLGLADMPDGSGLRVYGSAGDFLAVACTDLTTDSLVSRKWFGGRWT